MSSKNLKIIRNEFIPDYKLHDFNSYYKKCTEDFSYVKKVFPLLKLTSLPTIIPKQIFITGDLIPIELLSKCKTILDIQRYSLYIFALYPDDFPETEIFVEDLCKKIIWDKLPLKHKHENIHPITKRHVLCTHHPNGEINKLMPHEKSIAVLSSSWKLYRQYKKYLQTGNWNLDDLLHGVQGERQLRKDNSFYEKGEKGGARRQ